MKPGVIQNADFHGDHEVDTPEKSAAVLKEIAGIVDKFAPYDGRFDLACERVRLYRQSSPEKGAAYMLTDPCICIVPQGEKAVSFGHNDFSYDESNFVVYAAQIPINIEVTRASRKTPYFCIILPIDLIRLSELINKVFPNGMSRTEDIFAVYVGQRSLKILKSVRRVFELIEDQEDVDLLVPIAIDEILVRLLRSPMGQRIAQMAIADSYVGKVAKSIAWIKKNYSKSIHMEELAQKIGMSLSAFYTSFKMVTSMSPLQYQKALRLQEARQMIRVQKCDVTTSAYKVGYKSSSQFSREYKRYFHVAPSKDL